MRAWIFAACLVAGALGGFTQSDTTFRFQPIVGQARLRSVFRDLKVEAALMTDSIVDLDQILMHYKRAWNFYKNNLSRRKEPMKIALELLRYCYPPYLSNLKSATIIQYTIKGRFMSR